MLAERPHGLNRMCLAAAVAVTLAVVYSPMTTALVPNSSRMFALTRHSLAPVKERLSDDPQLKSSFQQRREALKQELMRWSEQTERGFRATSSEQGTVKDIIFELAKYNPTESPATAYYENGMASNRTSLAGKWTLIFTDAPDITGLESNNPFVELGRIGQECEPPTIANVIEWKAPEWVDNSPLVPSFLKGQQNANDRRIIQKVVTQGKASPRNPSLVNLDVAGLKVEASKRESSGTGFQESIEQRGLIAGLLEQRPLDLQGPLKAPFGTFEIIYLDDTMRITRTGQNFFAVNRRIQDGDEEWF